MKIRVINRQVLIDSFILMIVTGCGVYQTQTSDIPLISGKNNLRMETGISVIPSAQATISYGLTNKIALQTYGSISIEDRYYFQIAPGFYKKFGNRNVMELYTGFGHGYGNTQKDRFANDLYPHNFTENMYGSYELYFTQINLGKIAASPGQMDYGFGIKTGYFHTSLTDQNYSRFISDSGPFPHYKENNILIEPVLFFRSGKERVKFSYKVGLTQIIKLHKNSNDVPICGLSMGFGINFNFNSKQKSAR